MVLWLVLGLAAGATQTAAQAAEEEAPLVDRVEIQNNQYLQKETLLFYISTKAGERYDERRLKDDYRRLWETGFLDDLILDVRDSPQGKLVVFKVVERKRIQIIDYRGARRSPPRTSRTSSRRRRRV